MTPSTHDPSCLPDAVVKFSRNGSLPLFVIYPGTPQDVFSRINAWAVAAIEPYLAVTMPAYGPSPEVLAQMLDRLEAIPELAAISVGDDDRLRGVLSPDLRLAILRRSALCAAHGFDVAYGGLGEALDLGWRWWLMGYQVEAVKCTMLLPGLPLSYPVALAWRNLLWTLAKNCESQTMGIEVANVMLTYMAMVYEEVSPAVSPAPPAHITWFRRRWVNLRRYLWDKPGQLRIYHDDPAVPHVQIPSALIVATVTLNDVVTVMPTLLESHRWIQSQRVRSDAEISAMLDITLPAWIKQRFLELAGITYGYR